LREKEFYKFKADELKKGLKSFPADFTEVHKGRSVKLPSHPLFPGREFFGKIEITAPDGTQWSLSDDISEAKYIIYSRQNGYSEVSIPEEKLMKEAVTEYEKYLDSIMKDIEKDFRSRFPEGDKSYAVAEIFRHLNLVRY
jgi:hypothetical protein